MPRGRAGGGVTLDNVQDDLRKLRDDIAVLAQQIETLLSESGSAARDEVIARLHRAGQAVDDIVSETSAKGIEAAKALGDAGDSLVKDVEGSVRERPFTALAIALGIGYLISSMRR